MAKVWQEGGYAEGLGGTGEGDKWLTLLQGRVDPWLSDSPVARFESRPLRRHSKRAGRRLRDTMASGERGSGPDGGRGVVGDGVHLGAQARVIGVDDDGDAGRDGAADAGGGVVVEDDDALG